MREAYAIVAALAASLAMQAAAAQLGELSVYSRPGEPLDAEIEVLSGRDFETLTARIASSDAYRAAGARYESAFAAARVTLRRRNDGRLYLRATTREPVHARTVELLVDVSTGARSTHRYAYGMVLGSTRTAAVTAPESVAAIPLHAPAPDAASRATEPVTQVAPDGIIAKELSQKPPAPPRPDAPRNVWLPAGAVSGAPSPEPAAPSVPRSPHRASAGDAPGTAAQLRSAQLGVAPQLFADAYVGTAATPEYERGPGQRILQPANPQRLPEIPNTLPGPLQALPIVPLPPRDQRPPRGRERLLTVPQTAVRPTIDGVLGDSAWKSAAVTGHFWIPEQQRWPTEQTEVLVMADREYLYFGFRMYDRQPQAVQALQTRRGAGLGLDDQVGVEIDPFLSHREISTYSVNANGVQDDAIAGGRARQLAWKGDWHGAAVRTPYGWSAEIAIPFSILNFEPGTTEIGINFFRYQQRSAEWSRWADWTVRRLPEEMGRLTGLQLPLATRSNPWTFMPYALVGRNARDKRGELHDELFSVGTEIRYQPRPNLTGVISLNPDFSQVESAIANINFNYNEKFRADPRPFFQEGGAYFGNNRGYFYTNRIPDFDYGAKFFTRMSGYQVGALATRAPGDRSDFVLHAQRELDATHSVGGMVVATDRPSLRNRLYVVRGQGREASGLNYALDAAVTTTEDAPGDGSRLAGSIGWTRDYWSIGATADRYSVNYRPANGLLDLDLPDTRGVTGFVSYYRDFGDGPVRELTGSYSWHGRDTEDGRRQRRIFTGGGSVELREQVRFGLWYTEGIYRPVGSRPGRWADTLNDDFYWTASLDLNTRSSRFGMGGSYSSGFLAGDDYDYSNLYTWARPTRTTFINVTSERLVNYGEFFQHVFSAGWDITSRHGIVGRYISGDFGDAFRLAYSLHVRRNIDFFLVYDREPAQLARLSAKVVMTLQ